MSEWGGEWSGFVVDLSVQDACGDPAAELGNGTFLVSERCFVC